MKTSSLILTACILLVSCTGSKLSDFQQAGTTYSSPIYRYTHQRSSDPTLTNRNAWAPETRATYLGSIEKVNIGNYIYLTDNDVVVYSEARINQRKDIVKWMYECLTYRPFDLKGVCSYFEPLCSSDVLAAIHDNKNHIVLKGWQILTLPKGNDNYTIAYEGNDWFSITSGPDQVRLQIVYYGREMKPVLIAIDNPARNIKVGMTPSTTFKGYKYAHITDYFDYKLSRTVKYCDKPAYTSYITQDIVAFSNSNPQYTHQGLITNQTFNAYREHIIEQNKQIATTFYNDVASATPAALNTTYKAHLFHPLNTAIKERNKKDPQPLEGWQLFWNSDTSNKHFTVNYVGNNWYEVSTPDTPGKAVKIMPAQLTDKHHTPIILGLQNQEYHFDQSIFSLMK